MGRKRNRRSFMMFGHRHILPMLLAASTKIDAHDCRRLMVKCLKMHLHFVQAHQRTPDSATLEQILPNVLLALLPMLIHTKYKNVLSLGAEIVGAVSLYSMDANIKLVYDANVLHGLIYMLSRSNPTIVAACNAIMDLMTTVVGLEQLKETSALDKLLSLFCHCGLSVRESDLSLNQKKGCNDTIMKILDPLLILLNACGIERLMRISRELRASAQFTLRCLWCNFPSPMTKNWKVKGSSKEECAHDQRLSYLAGAVFRLSMMEDHGTCVLDTVKRSLFGDGESWFQYFILNHWENSAVLVKQSSKALKDNAIFSLFNDVDSLNVHALLNLVLNRSVSCPPIVSDELNFLHMLEDIKGELGHPMRYRQDICLVKTLKEVNAKCGIGYVQKEVHYFDDYAKAESSEMFDTVNIEDCINAYYKGYTISLRGMEFRSKKVAAIAHSLGIIFGQPPAGANLYLTPPQTQGLARHCDDHCVFVCQLAGRKQWTVFPRKTSSLPRLYDQSSYQCSDCGSETCGEEFLLNEGDVLYIPRGCPHEAHTVTNGGANYMNKSNEFSLHLTLSVEVEPPFEWEGFAHVALYSQTQGGKRTQNHLNLISVNLLHVSIGLVAKNHILFRKACMVGILGSKYGTDCRIPPTNLDHKPYFSDIMNIINDKCNFSEAFSTVEAAVREKNIPILESMRWLRNLQLEEEMTVETEWANPLEFFKSLPQLDESQILELESEFWKVKSDFCEKAVFDDVCEVYGMLLVKYMKVREYYINGMLSLHNSAEKY